MAGTFFRPPPRPPLAGEPGPLRRAGLDAPVPCVNGTISGFAAARVGVIRKQVAALRQTLGSARPLVFSAMAATVRLGTCSWADEGLVKTGIRRASRLPKARLRYYAQRFDTVEVDSTFYALPDPEVAAWVERTPPEFVFHVKASAR